MVSIELEINRINRDCFPKRIRKENKRPETQKTEPNQLRSFKMRKFLF